MTWRHQQPGHQRPCHGAQSYTKELKKKWPSLCLWAVALRNHTRRGSLSSTVMNTVLWPPSCHGLNVFRVWSVQTFCELKTIPQKLLSGDCHRNPMMISQHWFNWWLGVNGIQVITCSNVDHYLDCCMASVGHNMHHYWVYKLYLCHFVTQLF